MCPFVCVRRTLWIADTGDRRWFGINLTLMVRDLCVHEAFCARMFVRVSVAWVRRARPHNEA